MPVYFPRGAVLDDVIAAESGHQRRRTDQMATKATAAPSKRASNTKPAAKKATPATPRSASRAAAAAAKLAAPPVEPAPVELTVEVIAAMPRLDRLAAARVENETIKAWKAAGEPEPRPSTPVLDWMNATPRNSRKPKSASTGRGKYTPETGDALKARITTDRAAGLGFPKIAAALNVEQFDGKSDWTGPKLYAFACRQGIGDKLSVVKVAS